LYSEPFVDFILISCYYNLLCLYSGKGKSFILVELEKIASLNSLAASRQGAADQSLSVSSLLLRSLTNDSVTKSGGDKSQVSRGSRGSSVSGPPITPPIITTRPRGSTRTSPSPIMFNKTGRSSVSPSMMMVNDAGITGSSSSNPYTNETLQSLLGLARIPSSDQDRNLLGFDTPHNASAAALGGTAGGSTFLSNVSLEKNQSFEEIDFTMNTLIEGVYNDILPYSEANVSFILKCQESVSFASASDFNVKFVGSLEQVTSSSHFLF
jgi:hypothetical protein